MLGQPVREQELLSAPQQSVGDFSTAGKVACKQGGRRGCTLLGDRTSLRHLVWFVEDDSYHCSGRQMDDEMRGLGRDGCDGRARWIRSSYPYCPLIVGNVWLMMASRCFQSAGVNI